MILPDPVGTHTESCEVSVASSIMSSKLFLKFWGLDNPVLRY